MVDTIRGSAPSHAGGKRRILVLDDSELNLHFTRSMLVLEGYDVRCAASLREFEAALASWYPNMVLIDVRMPTIAGTDLCRQLKSSARTSHIAVILFSSMPETELAQLAREAEADAFVSKAGGYERFSQVLEEVCGSRQW